MSDDLDRLEAAMRADVPKAPEEVRHQAIAAGMTAFEKHHKSLFDGESENPPLSKGIRSWLLGLSSPKKSRTYATLAGAASFALVALVAVYLIPLFSSPVGDAPKSAHEDVASVEDSFEHRQVDDDVFLQAPATTVFPDGPTESFGIVNNGISGQPNSPAATFEDELRSKRRDYGRDRFTRFGGNPIRVVAEVPVSTFSIDVDRASYSFVRASLRDGILPQKNAVRVEELVNYFPYNYPVPESQDAPFAASVLLLPAPWNPDNRLLHIGIKGYLPDGQADRRSNLVFLIDTSGSMGAPNKLPLVISSLKLLLSALASNDRVAIITYAGSAGVLLEPTPVEEAGKIAAALDRLDADGYTAGGEGIRQAYLLAEQHYIDDGINRVILATDGDFNVGITDIEELADYIERKRAGGVMLSVLGFGKGDYNDALMQRLAQNGNGHAVYIDSLSEARKALVEESTSMLFPIAKDVKIQIEFNPASISEYRLIGYETRMLAREDFRNDKVDAGEIGAGHAVTAIYELTPTGSGAERIASLRYRRAEGEAAVVGSNEEMAFLKIRYKLPQSDVSKLIEQSITSTDVRESVAAAPDDVRFAVAVAAFGQLLRGGRYTGNYGHDDVIALAQGAKGEDPYGYRAEFIGLVRLAELASAMDRPLVH